MNPSRHPRGSPTLGGVPTMPSLGLRGTHGGPTPVPGESLRSNVIANRATRTFVVARAGHERQLDRQATTTPTLTH
jgi:hypothetical protein